VCQRKEGTFWLACPPAHPHAVKFDILGALERAAGGPGKLLADAEETLSATLGDDEGGALSWGMRDGRTQAQVLALFARAMAKAEAIERGAA
jgi:hypothetical protein